MSRSRLLNTRPIAERIDTFLESRSNVLRVPVHPDDIKEAQTLYAMGYWGDEPSWKLTVLGEGHKENSEAEDE